MVLLRALGFGSCLTFVGWHACAHNDEFLQIAG